MKVKGHRIVRARVVTLAVATSCILLATGCTHSSAPTSLSPAAGKSFPVDRHQLQADLMNYVDDLIAGIGVTFGHTIDDHNAPNAIDFAANQRLEIATSALDDAVQINQLSGLMNAYVLVRLSRRELDRPSSAKLLGDDYPLIREFMRQEESDARTLIAKYLSVAQQEELEAEIAKWIAENPDDHSVTHVNLVDFSLSSDASSANTSGSIFSLLNLDPLSDIDPAVREVAQTRQIAERVFFYTQHASVILSWRAQYLYQKMLAAPQVANLQSNLDSLNETGKHFATLGDRLTAVAENLPINKFTAIDQAQLSAVQTGNTLMQQATTRVSQEREASLQQLSQLLQNQQTAATINASKVITQAVSQVRKIVFVAAALVIAGLILIVIVHHWLSSRRLHKLRRND